MTEKEKLIFNEIIKYYQKNNTMPSMYYLKEKLNYKSINSIYQFFKSLEKKELLKRNMHNKLIPKNIDTLKNNIDIIDIVNSKEKINLILNDNKKYLGYKLKNNIFEKECHLIKNDILIIEVNKKLKNNDLGLFIIDNKYRVMKYKYQDGFYLLKDSEELFLYKVNIIGKVIMTIRKIKRDM